MCRSRRLDRAYGQRQHLGLRPPPAAGDNFAISISAESRERCDDLCTRLSEGGEVTTPPQEMFWGAYFGCWTDRFGIKWMVNCELEKE